MKKALLTALLLVPFLSLANDNIFTNGTIQLEEPKISSVWSTVCVTQFGDLTVGGEGTYTDDDGHSACQSALFPLTPEPSCAPGYPIVISTDVEYRPGQITRSKFCSTNSGSPKRNNVNSYRYTFKDLVQTTAKTCPPEAYPTFTSTFTGDTGDKCYSSSEANLKDSCNISSGNQYLTNAVDSTKPQICHTQSDGSICSYKATDIGGGKQAYQLDLEGDCYTDPKPDVGTPEQQQPNNDDCKDYGDGLLGCPADPEDVCQGTGSTIGGTGFNQCQTGCGYINDQFMCIDTDTDGDGLPDFNDPDIDGDGIPNDEDTDEDGDGKDDGLDQPSQGGNGQGSGGGASFDDSGIINAINKLRTSLITDQDIDDGSDIKKQVEEGDKELDKKITEFFDDDNLKGIDTFVKDNAIEDQFFNIRSSFSGASCTDVTFDGYGTLELCDRIAGARPFLYIAFGLGTAIYLIFRFTMVIREVR